MSANQIDFSKDLTTHCSVTIRTSVANDIDDMVSAQKEAQPKIANKITRSSVMSILLSEALEARANA
ncbi:MAG: hypothetical protein MJK15_00700 [Colwellia sp.]|nr:hypothetical protein [Colwellia sp.]